MQVEILKDYRIAFDGINVSQFIKGEIVDLTDNEINRLRELEVVAPLEVKVVEPEIKEKPKKRRAKKNDE